MVNLYILFILKIAKFGEVYIFRYITVKSDSVYLNIIQKYRRCGN